MESTAAVHHFNDWRRIRTYLQCVLNLMCYPSPTSASSFSFGTPPDEMSGMSNGRGRVREGAELKPSQVSKKCRAVVTTPNSNSRLERGFRDRSFSVPTQTYSKRFWFALCDFLLFYPTWKYFRMACRVVGCTTVYKKSSKIERMFRNPQEASHVLNNWTIPKRWHFLNNNTNYNITSVQINPNLIFQLFSNICKTNRCLVFFEQRP